MAEDFAELFRPIGIAILITYIVVAAIMASWAYAFIILLTVPMALIGVVPAMLISGTSIFALIGVIMLIGMVVNNAIVVVDYAEMLRRDENVHPYQAVEQASEVRLKALVMAVATSVVSLLPLAMSADRGAACVPLSPSSPSAD
jgi:HAE1 family hydrophobic/amphiphilic exporter-1